MGAVNKKISKILKLNFGIHRSNISDTTNLIKEFGLCDWELDLLYSKLEIAFNIEIHHKVPKDDVCVRELKKEIEDNIYSKRI